MATNTGDNYRVGSVKDRMQHKRPDGNYQKRNMNNGQFMTVKDDGKPLKGVAKDVDERRS